MSAANDKAPPPAAKGPTIEQLLGAAPAFPVAYVALQEGLGPKGQVLVRQIPQMQPGMPTAMWLMGQALAGAAVEVSDREEAVAIVAGARLLVDEALRSMGEELAPLVADDSPKVEAP